MKNDKVLALALAAALLMPSAAHAAPDLALTFARDGAPAANVTLPQKAELRDGHLTFPLRDCARLLRGATLQWDDRERVATLTYKDKTVRVSTSASSAGLPGYISGGRTYVGLRDLVDTLGGTTRYEAATHHIYVQIGEPAAKPGTPAPAPAPANDYDRYLAKAGPALLDAGTTASPLSLYFGLAMLAEGARGDTAAAYQALLGDAATRDKLLGLARGDKPLIAMSNRLYTVPAEPANPAYQKTIRDTFGGTVETANLADPAVMKQISEAIAKDSRGLLHPELEADPRLKAALLNVIAMESPWQTPFIEELTAPAPFHAPKGDITVPTMTRTDHFDVRHEADWTSLRLPLQNGARLALVLPAPGKTPADLRKDPNLFVRLAQPGSPTYTELYLPRFDQSAELNLLPVLERLGLPLGGDLSGIRDGFRLGAGKQWARVKIDEKGLSAAAATYFGIMKSAAPDGEPQVLRFDRPFLYVLEDPEGRALFLGQVDSPAR